MESQLEIFPVTKTIPDWVADCFFKANSGTYGYKQEFYSLIKPFVLKTYGEPAGYDLQIIEKKCWSCDGTGVYKHYHYEDGHQYLIKKEPCWHCFNGIYYRKEVVLQRWVLNGRVYHMPLACELKFKFENTIKGIVEHENVDSNEALIAYLILLWKYNKSVFYNHLKEYAAIKIDRIKDALASLIRKDNTNDELPF